MNRALTVSITIAFVTTLLAGCLGDGDDVDSAIPVARVSVTEVGGKIDTFLFDASASNGRGLKFEWDFGDNTESGDAIVEHTYEFGAGTYTASLTITDAAGIKDIWEEDIQVGDGINLPPKAFFEPSTRYLAVGEPLTVDAKLTQDQEGDPLVFEWDFNFVMTETEYIDFREAKMEADWNDAVVAGGASVQEGDGGTGETSASLPVVDPSDVTDIINGGKSPGHDHGGSAPEVSLFNGYRGPVEDPVFTLEEGFPDPTRFYVKLTAYDIKGETREILSEEIWPVEVVETKKSQYVSGEYSDVFTLGGPSTLTQSTPDQPETEEYYDDEYMYEFNTHSAIQEMYVNVTWNQNPAGEVDAAAANAIEIEVISPNQKTRSDDGTEGISLQMTSADELGFGEWDVWLFARGGAQIEWTITYWALMDLNPFRDLEAPYVLEERPDEEL